MKSIEELRKANSSKLSLNHVSSEGEVRCSVSWFATMMELKLQKNDNKPGWDKCNELELLNRIEQELKELTNAVLYNESPEAIIKECADVANFSMMIADITRRRIK